MHKHHFHRIISLNSKLKDFYYHKTLYAFAFKLITIFVPIYLLILGFPLIAVIGWLLLKRLSQPFFTIMGIRIANWIGMKKTFIFIMFVGVGYLSLLSAISQNIIFLIPAALAVGMFGAIYSSQEIVLFTEISKKREIGAERGLAKSLQEISGFFAPIIGAFILIKFGMSNLVIIASVIALLSIIPLLMIKNVHFKLKMKLHDRSKKHKIKIGTLIELAHKGIHDEAKESIWPIFLFISGIELMSVGIVGALFALAGIITPFLIGRLVDINRKKIMYITTFGYFVAWSIAAFYPNEIMLYVLSFLIGAASSGLWLSICRKVIELGKKNDPSLFGPIWEMTDDLGRAFTLFIALFVLTFATMQIMFIILAGIALLFIVWEMFR